MGDIANGHYARAFVEAFNVDIIAREGIMELGGGALVSKSLDWDPVSFDVRIYYVIRDARGDEYTVRGDACYYHPDNDDDDAARVVAEILHGKEASDEQVDAVFLRLRAARAEV